MSKQEEIANQFLILITKYLNKQINLGKFRDDFDKIYYYLDHDETSFIHWYMRMLSFTTDNLKVLNDPNESGTISEDRLREYSVKMLDDIANILTKKDCK